MQRKVSLSTLVTSVAIAVIFTFLLTFFAMQIAKEAEINDIRQDYAEEYAEYEDIFELYSHIPEDKRNPELYRKLLTIDYYYRTYYVGDIDEDQLVYYLSNGYIAGIGDKYGEYYTAEDYYDLLTQTEGNLVGIGIYVRKDPDSESIKILKIMPSSPALEAGLLEGDLITHVNGVSAQEIGYEETVNRIAGEEGTQVEITIMRGTEAQNVTLTRRKVETQTVFHHIYEGDDTVGVIRVLEFNNAMPDQFKNAVNILLNSGCTSLVFDMRGNTGGTLSSCVEVLDFLLPKGDIVYVTDAEGNVTEKYTSGSSSIDVPMAVLTDGYTASAAELFTCALRDYDKAIVVGTKTYGKGCVQTISTLYDYSGLRMTTYMYNPPKSANYDEIGITPDIVVELDESLADKNYFEIGDSEDNQLREATEALTNNN